MNAYEIHEVEMDALNIEWYDLIAAPWELVKQADRHGNGAEYVSIDFDGGEGLLTIDFANAEAALANDFSDGNVSCAFYENADGEPCSWQWAY